MSPWTIYSKMPFSQEDALCLILFLTCYPSLVGILTPACPFSRISSTPVSLEAAICSFIFESFSATPFSYAWMTSHSTEQTFAEHLYVLGTGLGGRETLQRCRVMDPFLKNLSSGWIKKQFCFVLFFSHYIPRDSSPRWSKCGDFLKQSALTQGRQLGPFQDILNEEFCSLWSPGLRSAF